MKHNYLHKIDWLDGEKVRPYVFFRQGNEVKDPGSRFHCDWFPFEPMGLDSLKISSLDFSEHILNMEHRAFRSSQMPIPRWAFYDCALMPGFVSGFAHRTSMLSKEWIEALGNRSQIEWTPISLFIIIPTMGEGEWMAHNLCSMNTLIKKESRYYGLGFLTKAFGLWYANVETCCGVTQWTSPALRLHAHYGDMEILSSYTLVHDYAHTLTYRLKVNANYWESFFTGQFHSGFTRKYHKQNFDLNHQSASSLMNLQEKIEMGEGPFYLHASDMSRHKLEGALPLYQVV